MAARKHHRRTTLTRASKQQQHPSIFTYCGHATRRPSRREKQTARRWLEHWQHGPASMERGTATLKPQISRLCSKLKPPTTVGFPQQWGPQASIPCEYSTFIGKTQPPWPKQRLSAEKGSGKAMPTTKQPSSQHYASSAWGAHGCSFSNDTQ
jgi:hypothetical protein